MSGTVAEWVDRARHDLDTARAMLDAGRYLYVLFCCQRAAEKALKAVIVKKTGGLPPRIHTLPKLAESANVPLDEELAEYMAALSVLYVHTRYPEEVELPSSAKNIEQMIVVMRKTEEVT